MENSYSRLEGVHAIRRGSNCWKSKDAGVAELRGQVQLMGSLFDYFH